MAERLTVLADDLRPFDLLGEGEVIRTRYFGESRPASWPDLSGPAIRCEVGRLYVDEIPTDHPAFPTVRAPRWEGMHDRWFDFGEEVTVMRGWMAGAEVPDAE